MFVCFAMKCFPTESLFMYTLEVIPRKPRSRALFVNVNFENHTRICSTCCDTLMRNRTGVRIVLMDLL